MKSSSLAISSSGTCPPVRILTHIPSSARIACSITRCSCFKRCVGLDIFYLWKGLIYAPRIVRLLERITALFQELSKMYARPGMLITVKHCPCLGQLIIGNLKSELWKYTETRVVNVIFTHSGAV